ncbi:TetR/AcrR family transcriptional regulator [Gordonia phthalatica]|nr:TetR/AcrR family transcriptional regulator [Gordonia phthalatica]
MVSKERPPISAEKRAQMLEKSLAVFVERGYVGASTDELAAAASVSKQTLYRAFGDKEGLFEALIRTECDRVYDPFAPLVEEMRDVESAEAAIRRLAEQSARLIMSQRVQQLRRLVIAEATRFPALGELYWERGFVRVSASLAQCLTVLDERRLLRVPQPALSAQQLAGMLLWIPSNRTMFAGIAQPMSAGELADVIDAGVAAFVRAHR